MPPNHETSLRPVLAADADALYPLIAGTAVIDTILWDGPTSLDEFRDGLAERAAKTKAGELHMFTILCDGRPAGSADLRPSNDFRGDMGLWVGTPFQGRGVGTAAIAAVTRYAFELQKLRKLEATIFVGNHASRRAFEKNGFVLEGTIRSAIRKRGRYVDEWLLGRVRET